MDYHSDPVKSQGGPAKVTDVCKLSNIHRLKLFLVIFSDSEGCLSTFTGQDVSGSALSLTL